MRTIIGVLFYGSMLIGFTLAVIITVIAFFVKRSKHKKAGEDYSELKRKTSKRLLLLSFAPYALLILYPLLSAVAGIEEFTFFSPSRTIYGWDALIQALFWNVYIFLRIIPIIPACAVYQLVRLIVLIIKLPKHIKKRIIIAAASAAGIAVIYFSMPVVTDIVLKLIPANHEILEKIEYLEGNSVLQNVEIMYISPYNNEKQGVVIVEGTRELSYEEIIKDLIRLTSFIKNMEDRSMFRYDTVSIRRTSDYGAEKGKRVYSVGFDMTVTIEFREDGEIYSVLHAYNVHNLNLDNFDFTGFDLVKLGTKEFVIE